MKRKTRDMFNVIDQSNKKLKNISHQYFQILPEELILSICKFDLWCSSGSVARTCKKYMFLFTSKKILDEILSDHVAKWNEINMSEFMGDNALNKFEQFALPRWLFLPIPVNYTEYSENSTYAHLKNELEIENKYKMREKCGFLFDYIADINTEVMCARSAYIEYNEMPHSEDEEYYTVSPESLIPIEDKTYSFFMSGKIILASLYERSLSSRVKQDIWTNTESYEEITKSRRSFLAQHDINIIESEYENLQDCLINIDISTYQQGLIFNIKTYENGTKYKIEYGDFYATPASLLSNISTLIINVGKLKVYSFGTMETNYMSLLPIMSIHVCPSHTVPKVDSNIIKKNIECLHIHNCIYCLDRYFRRSDKQQECMGSILRKSFDFIDSGYFAEEITPCSFYDCNVKELLSFDTKVLLWIERIKKYTREFKPVNVFYTFK